MPGTSTATIFIKEEPVILSALRAVYWPAGKALIVADLHLGKTGYFRRHGIPVSSGVLEDDLKRLTCLIEGFQPEQLLIAGDLFHHQFNKDILIFQQWRNRYKTLALTLVPGNHDRYETAGYTDLGIEVTAEEYLMGNFRIIHDRQSVCNDRFSFSGHLHPGYTIAGKARQRICLPCFIKTEDYMVLPAFSAFTGLFTGYEAPANTAYFVINNDKLFSF
ncbi:ligase-associated DNA damage response endonuclease PdeM [Niabella soli]|uniref:Phosphoesterase n=1 Tax=Niabella soli DSM 19437 TaxID=929713 RepID=W0EVS5_9BACT|nr:ligase-associated DNA damage response endonuclease PdeM [Niabella soli]AHF14915.1 phosphoesterase [Niabella soli DSM 19437]